MPACLAEHFAFYIAIVDTQRNRNINIDFDGKTVDIHGDICWFHIEPQVNDR